jgi:SAM-dependent methyltransferase
MSSPKTPSQAIREHWENAAASPLDPQGLKPTARDPYLQQAVEAAILRRLPQDASLIDLGCGDGASTRCFSRRCREALGVDFVEGFVQRAREANTCSHVRFEQGDVQDLHGIKEACGQFDVAVSIRCLINLPDFERQAVGIGQIASLVRPGGLYLASEGWQEGFDGLNERRRQFGLPAMRVAEYNTLLRRADFEREASRHFEIVGYEGLGYYLFMSRVFQPLLTHPEPPSHQHPVNRVAAQMQERMFLGTEYLDCDYAGVYVLRKK